MLLHASTIFLGAFLLFLVQPMIAKIILPWFGGGAAIWTTCMLFFQAALLGGYAYAHATNRYLTPRRQAMLHIALLALSLALLPIVPQAGWKPAGTEDPAARILLLLLATIGLPYFLLSTTSPLLQSWIARSVPGAFPYRLFALSNLASMLALLGYPVLIEPRLSTRLQANSWSVAYAIFALLCGFAAWRSLRNGKDTAHAAQHEDGGKVGAGMMLLWMGLAACASTLLLAITTHLSQDVAPIPFLWVLPLSIYLLSFILCFEGRGWYDRRYYLVPTLLGIGLMAWASERTHSQLPFRWAIALFAAGLFLCSMTCHGELARLKPHPRRLTLFYLMISVGGALGGLFVALAAPHMFSMYLELPIGYVLCTMLIIVVLTRDPESRFYRARWRPGWALLLALILALTGFLARKERAMMADYTWRGRDFYGTLRVMEDVDADGMPYRKLVHGTINHGEQYMVDGRRREVTTYFGPNSGAGRAMRYVSRRPQKKVGIIGLGAGVLASYGRIGDVFRFYEIDRQVLDVANTWFSFLKDCPCRVESAIADGRLSLEREPSQQFDLLAVDAFSSDSVPAHLLTREAFELYFKHLKGDGILVVQISNKYLDLAPVVRTASDALGKASWLVDDDGDDELGLYGSTYVLLANSPRTFAAEEFKGGEPPEPRNGFRMWTDDYSNLFSILK